MTANDQTIDPRILIYLTPILLFDLVIRGYALWRSSRNNQKWWFIFLLIINSLGILPAIYLLTHPEPAKHSKKKK